MDGASRQIIKKKFEVAFTIAKNNLALTKMKPICELEERHGVNLGLGYKINQACATFIEFIALDQQHSSVEALSRVNFFSLQADGSTDFWLFTLTTVQLITRSMWLTGSFQSVDQTVVGYV